MATKEDRCLSFCLQDVPTAYKFVERPQDAKELEKHLLTSQNCHCKVFILHGLGGIGKTQLAAHFAHRHRDAFSSVLWLNASSESCLQHDLEMYGRKLFGLEDRAVNDAELANHTLEWLFEPSNTGWLLVLDQLGGECGQHNSVHGKHIERCLRGGHGSVLITTRLSHLAQLGHSKALQRVDHATSASILEKWWASDNSDASRTAISELVRLLDGLPLAIAHAGNYIQETGCSISSYMDLYNHNWNHLMERTAHHDLHLLDFYLHDIGSAWLASLEAVEAEHSKTGKLLLLWTCLDNESLWYGLLQPACQLQNCPGWFMELLADEGSFLSAMKVLLRRSLIEKGENGTFSMHPVVHNWISSIRNNQGEMKNCRKLALFAVAAAIPANTEPNFWVLQRRLLPHARKCWQWLMQEDSPRRAQDSTFVLAVAALGDLCADQGHLGAAESLYKHALRATSGASLETDITILGIKRTLANVLHHRDKTLQAKKTFLEVLRGCQWVSEKGRGQMIRCCDRYLRQLEADTRNDYANLCIALRELEDVEQLLGEVLEARKGLHGMDHPSTLNTINDLATLYQCQGRYDLAEDYLRLALNGQINSMGRDHTFTLTTVNNLGLLYAGRDRLGQGLELCRMALEGFENTLGVGHYLTVNVVRNIGNILDRQGSFLQAAEMYKRAKREYQSIYGRRHSLYISTRSELNRLLRRMDGIEVSVEAPFGNSTSPSPFNLSFNLLDSHEHTASACDHDCSTMLTASLAGSTTSTPLWQDAGGVKLEPE